MKHDSDILPAKDRHIVELVKNQKLVIEFHPTRNDLNIVGPNGATRLSIQVTENGPVLKIGRGSLAIQIEGNLSIDAEQITIHGRKGMALTTDGDIRIDAAGDLISKAHTQKVRATPGNVDIEANDDITLDGERIRMNC